MRVPIQYDGKEYESIKECCAVEGVTYGSVYDHCKRTGCTVEEAIDHFVKLGPKQDFVYHGQSYPNVTACCKALGIIASSVSGYRGRTGCTTEEAIDHCLAVKFGFVYHGQSYPSRKACCDALGVPYRSVIKYRRCTGCTEEEAIDCLLNLKKGFVYQGKRYPHTKACCAAIGVSYGAVLNHRRRTGCTVEEAIDYLLKLKDGLAGGFVYQGKRYPSRKTCCETLGANYVSVQGYLHRTGCTWEEAIAYFLQPANLKPLYTGRTTGKKYYSGVCRTCKRKLLLAEDELAEFAHSDEFCKNHVIPW